MWYTFLCVRKQSCQLTICCVRTQSCQLTICLNELSTTPSTSSSLTTIRQHGACYQLSPSASWTFGAWGWYNYRRCPNQWLMHLNHLCCVPRPWMLYKVHTEPKYWLHGEWRVRHTGAAVEAHQYEFDVSRCRTILIRKIIFSMHRRLFYVFHRRACVCFGTLNIFNEAATFWLLLWACFPIFSGTSASGTCSPELW